MSLFWRSLCLWTFEQEEISELCTAPSESNPTLQLHVVCLVTQLGTDHYL